MKSPVQLYLRVRLLNGKYPYLKAAYASNGRIRSNHAIHNGRAVEFPAAAYHLRYWRDNRRVWQPVGKDASLALVAMRNKALALQASEQSDPEFTSFAPAPSAVTPPDKRLLADCAKTYIAEITAHKSAKTLAAYRLTTLGILRCCHRYSHWRPQRRGLPEAHRTRGCLHRGHHQRRCPQVRIRAEECRMLPTHGSQPHRSASNLLSSIHAAFSPQRQ